MTAFKRLYKMFPAFLQIYVLFFSRIRKQFIYWIINTIMFIKVVLYCSKQCPLTVFFKRNFTYGFCKFVRLVFILLWNDWLGIECRPKSFVNLEIYRNRRKHYVLLKTCSDRKSAYSSFKNINQSQIIVIKKIIKRAVNQQQQQVE